MTMHPMLRRCVFILLACALSAIALLAIPVIYIWSVSGCDVHEDYQVSSPDGRWAAHETTTGCHGLFLSTYFDSKVIVLDAKRPAKRVPVIFESDGAKPVILTWTGPGALHIEIPEITEIYQSLRSYYGVRITYSVTPGVLQSIADIESHLGEGRGHLAPADEKIVRQVDEDYRRYLARCRDWIRLYASG